MSVRGQGELKRRARPDVAGSRKSSPVRFDDRTADRESHAHAAGLGSEEGVEQLVGVLGGDPDTAVRHRYQHLICFVLSDHQLARPICDRFHRFYAVDHQVDEHLLQLDPIGADGG